MLCVKNDVVKMDWPVEGFIENRNVGFLGAMWDYHGTVVVFQEGVVFAMVDDQGSLGIKDIANLIKKSYRIGKGKTPTVTREYDMEDFEEYIPIMSGGIPIDSNVALLGLTEDDLEDMKKRTDDLSEYYNEVIVDM